MQREIIRYTNADGHGISKNVLVRDSNARRALLEGDVKVGSTVGLMRGPMDPDVTRGGYGTPFYVGDVDSIEYDEAGAGAGAGTALVPWTGASSSQAAAPPRKIARVHVHFRMPLLRGRFVDDVQKPWGLACHGHHQWSSACERRVACQQAAAANGPGGQTKLLHVADVQELLEAELVLTATAGLQKKSKERLAEHGPPDGSWRPLLGLQEPGEKAQKPFKKRRR